MSKTEAVTLGALINPRKKELGVRNCPQQAIYLLPGWVSDYVDHALEGPNVNPREIPKSE